jgi:Arc/MetJ family transcription regulator
MGIKRKSHNLDEDLLRRARRSLGTATETDTIHRALEAVLVGERFLADLQAVRGRVSFRPGFIREMRRERRNPRVQ